MKTLKLRLTNKDVSKPNLWKEVGRGLVLRMKQEWGWWGVGHKERDDELDWLVSVA